MAAMSVDMVLKLNSPSKAAEQIIYKWPLISGSGSVSVVIFFFLYACSD